MTNLKVGCYIKIKNMEGEPEYLEKVGKVILIDDANQIHGTWGSCALIIGVDEFEVLPDERIPLFEMCEKNRTGLRGMNHLVDYYVSSVGMSEKEAVNYAIGLFHNGTIQEIQFIGKDGKEI